MGIRGAPGVNIHPRPEENPGHGERNRGTSGRFSEGSPTGVRSQVHHSESADLLPPRGRGSGLAHWGNNRNSMYSVNSFETNQRVA